ncbi:hypothetical protein BvCmsH99A_04304 [Escherichia coli]|nr:hypothetical protein BvCmsH99A_04304 [Escherichia coli]
MFFHQVISISFHLDNLAVDILARCQHDCRVDFQGDCRCARHNQNHANGLRATASLLQLWLVGLRTVRHGNQNTIIVIETNLADPETTFILGNNLFRDNLTGIGRVNGQQVQRRDAFLVNELRLRRIRGRQRTIRITDGHLRQVEFGTECRRVRQPRRALIGQNGKIFCGHAFTLRLSIKWMAEAG